MSCARTFVASMCLPQLVVYPSGPHAATSTTKLPPDEKY